MYSPPWALPNLEKHQQIEFSYSASKDFNLTWYYVQYFSNSGVSLHFQHCAIAWWKEFVSCWTRTNHIYLFQNAGAWMRNYVTSTNKHLFWQSHDISEGPLWGLYCGCVLWHDYCFVVIIGSIVFKHWKVEEMPVKILHRINELSDQNSHIAKHPGSLQTPSIEPRS